MKLNTRQSTKHTATDRVYFGTSSFGTETEFEMKIEFNVHWGCPATLIDPPEYPTAEIEKVTFIHDGKPVEVPEWMSDIMTSGDIHDWLVLYASEEEEAAYDEAQEMRWEEFRRDE